MTQPRRIVPGSTYLLTRRCEQRRLWLLPRGETVGTFGYLLGVVAARYGIQIHAAELMSNHWHAVVTDPRGLICEFARDLHSLVARALNHAFGRRESLWSSSGLSLVQLVGPEDVLEATVYTVTNPLAAGLVSTPSKWKGLRLTPRDSRGEARCFHRPAYFRERPDMPERVEVRVTVPDCWDHVGANGFVEQFEARLRRRTTEIRAEFRAARRRFLGMRRVQKQRLGARVTSSEEPPTIRPTVACKDPDLRLRFLGLLATFRRDYRCALEAWRAGDKTVEFPWGTLKMRDAPGVVVRPPPKELLTAA